MRTWTAVGYYRINIIFAKTKDIVDSILPVQLIVEVTDDDSLSAYLSVLVDVESINDNDPAIALAPSAVSFTESTAVGTTISTGCALSDADYPGGLDATVSVSIKGETESACSADCAH